MKYKEHVNVLADMWDQTGEKNLICPQCKSSLIMIQVEPISDPDNAYVPYKTVIECTSCDFSLDAESFTILGGVKDYDAEFVEIGSWAPSGSRVLSRYKHYLSFDLLKELKKTAELVEFLIVNKQVIRVIG
jgi:hypothetical protein